LYDFPESYGLTGSIDLPVKSITKKYRRGGNDFFQKDIYLEGLLGFYRYPFNYTGVIVLPSIGIRYFKKENFFTELSAGIGLLRTFYDGKVYQVEPNGSVKELPLFGRNYAITNVSYGLNWQLNKTKQKILAFRIKPSLWFQYPYNSFIKAHLSVEAGISYELCRIKLKPAGKINTYQ
jgi:hypothetical protein